MNISSINSIPAIRPTFMAKEKKAETVLPLREQIKVHNKFINIADDTIEELQDKINYTKRRITEDTKYLKDNQVSYGERQRIETTIMASKQRLERFSEELAKRLTKKI
ncbi:hypothetical protein IKQ21_06520 [bacterium]|nr:hypothetical protein [bacterium]